MTKSQILAKEYGFDDITDFLIAVGYNSLVPGICMTPGCNATYEYEPDQDRGFCEECGKNAVKSILVIEGYM